MKIGQLARESGIGVTTVRFYEQRGLIAPPPRGEGGQRRYPPEALARLQFIRHARALGLGLDEIAQLLGLRDDPAAPCERADQIVRQHLASVRERIAQLEQLEQSLARLAGACTGRISRDCAVMAELSDHDRCGHHAGEGASIGAEWPGSANR